MVMIMSSCGKLTNEKGVSCFHSPDSSLVLVFTAQASDKGVVGDISVVYFSKDAANPPSPWPSPP